MKKASIPDILGCCVSYRTTYFKEDAMNAFIEKHQKNIIGTALTKVALTFLEYNLIYYNNLSKIYLDNGCLLDMM